MSFHSTPSQVPLRLTGILKRCPNHLPIQVVTCLCWQPGDIPRWLVRLCLQHLQTGNGAWDKRSDSPGSQSESAVDQGRDSRSPEPEVKPHREFLALNLQVIKNILLLWRGGAWRGAGILLFPCSQLPFGDTLKATHGSLASPDNSKSCRAGSNMVDAEELALN